MYAWELFSVKLRQQWVKLDNCGLVLVTEAVEGWLILKKLVGVYQKERVWADFSEKWVGEAKCGQIRYKINFCFNHTHPNICWTLC